MIEMLPLEIFDSNLYFAFSCLMQVMGNSRKSNNVNNSESKGGKGARRKQHQTAGLVSAQAASDCKGYIAYGEYGGRKGGFGGPN